MFFYKHSVYQSEARICLSFSQSQPQNILKIWLSKNIEMRKFHDLTHAWQRWVGRGYQNKENLKICTFTANISNLGQPSGQLINFHN